MEKQTALVSQEKLDLANSLQHILWTKLCQELPPEQMACVRAFENLGTCIGIASYPEVRGVLSTEAATIEFDGAIAEALGVVPQIDWPLAVYTAYPERLNAGKRQERVNQLRLEILTAFSELPAPERTDILNVVQSLDDRLLGKEAPMS